MTTPESLIRQASRILMITHIAPDGDAIGGLLGLGLALKAAGKTVTVSCSDPVPSRFAYLPGYTEIVSHADSPGDLVVTLDCSDLRRVGSLYRADEWHHVPLLNIDHHVTNTHFGTCNWVEPGCVAASEMVLKLCDRLGLPVGANIATCLLYGILADTLGLRTDNVTPPLVGQVMRLMEAGAPLAAIMDQVFNHRPFGLLRAWQKALEAMHLQEGVIWASLPRQARHEAGWPDTDLQGLANFLLSAEEASVSAILVEKDDGQVEVGLRSRPPFDVSGVALALVGGGHPQASGCTTAGPLEAAVERVVGALRSLISDAKPRTG